MTKKHYIYPFGVLVILSLIISFLSCGKQQQSQPTDYVNLFIGTLDVGNTVPAATAPFGMMSCGPDNVFDEELDEYTSRAGYNYKKDSIRQFSMTHVSGWGCHGALDIPVMPTTKTPGISPVYNHRAYASKFSHDNETAVPGYYQVFLEDYNTNVQITATERSAILLLDYPEGEDAHLIFAPTNAANGITGAELIIDKTNNQVTGWATSGGFCWRDPRITIIPSILWHRFDTAHSGKGIWMNVL
jgi:putative alpha-1,2-mannosidase